MLGKILKFLIALALLPFIAAEALTLYDLALAAGPSGQLRSTWFISMGAGAVVWTLIFIFLPRTLWLYVLGHEFTHALATMLAGGKVSAFKVSKDGGHVVTDRVNWWITLSPYFVPLYALLWIGLWLSIDFYYPLKQWQEVLFFGIGFFWAFHATFTISMLHPKQTDLSREGFLFSGVIIASINLGLVLLLLAVLTHDVRGSADRFLQRTRECYLYTAGTFEYLASRGTDWINQNWGGKR